MIKFSTEQREAMTAGRAARRRLIKEARKAADRAKNSNRSMYLDSIIAGESGIGKTLNIKKELEEQGITYFEITGNSSLFGLMGNLMLLHNAKPKGERVVVFLDDCDFMFERKNINMLKHMTATQANERCFEYNKKITASSFNGDSGALVGNYYNEEQGKLTIPCDEFIFVIASNIILPDEQSIKTMSTAQQRVAEHLLAIRGRMNVFDFKLNKKEKWGWLYEVAINDGGLDMLENENDKLYLLDWLWNHWNRMKETSVRTIQKMGYEIIDDPEEYKDNWELDYLI